MKESSATDNNNNSLIVEEEDEERASSGVEIVATDTEESLSAEVVIGHQNRNRFSFTVANGSLVVATGVLGIASYGGYSIHSSKQQVVAALMNDVEKVDGYKFEGVGFCQDGSAGGGKLYDYIGYEGITSPQDCGERCSDFPGKNDAGLEFRGFTYRKDAKECFCHVDAFTGSASNEGKGEIQGTDGNEVAVCYKMKGGKSKSSKRGKSKSSKGNI